MNKSTSELHSGFLAILGYGLVIRIVVAALFKGHPIDIGTFSAWAGHAAEGLLAFYSPGYFADYPPGYIYVLWVIGKLQGFWKLGYDSPLYLLLLKSPAILADLATTWVLYRLALSRLPGWMPVVIAAAYALNPAVITNSALWGQIDGILTLFVLLGVLWLDRHPAASGAAFAVALLIKPQALIFAPVPLLWFADRELRQCTKPRGLAPAAFAAAGLLVFVLGVLPYTSQHGPMWVGDKYLSTMASYPYASLNAFNFFALVGGNGAETTRMLLFFDFKTWGVIFTAAIVAFSAWLVWRRGAVPHCLFLAAFLPTSVFVWSTKMHERYLFPALAMTLAYYILSRDRRMLWVFLGLSATLSVNVIYVLKLSLQQIWYVDSTDPLMLATSAANVALWALLTWSGYRVVTNR